MGWWIFVREALWGSRYQTKQSYAKSFLRPIYAKVSWWSLSFNCFDYARESQSKQAVCPHRNAFLQLVPPSNMGRPGIINWYGNLG
jgi:hypothetical protein